MSWTGLKYQFKALGRDKLCVLTFLLPIIAGALVSLMGDADFSSVAEPSFGIIEDDLSGEMTEWLETNGTVEIYKSRKDLDLAVLEPSTQTIGVLSDDTGLKTVRAGDELTMYAEIADKLWQLWEQRDMAEQFESRILPADSGNDILKPLLLVIVMATALFMGCTFNAMNILGEKEDGIVYINDILPMTRTQYVRQKITVGFLGGFFSAVITALICVRITIAQILPLLLLMVLSSWIAALMGLFIARFSGGLMVGIVYIKIIMIFFLALPILFYLLVPTDSIWYGLSYLFPSAATFYGLMGLMNGKTDIVRELLALAAHSTVWLMIYAGVARQRKQVVSS